jgi:hypothetical protein
MTAGKPAPGDADGPRAQGMLSILKGAGPVVSYV